MKRKFFGMLLMGAMTVASVGMFTSCKDYDDDINNLQKQIDAITAQKLQDQLNTLKSAAEAAKTAADNAQATANTAVANAKAADDAAKAAQGTADAANAAAKAAQAAAEAAQATANAAATKEYADQIKKAIDDLTPIVEGKVAKADFDEAIASIEAEIAAINEKLLTLDDVEELLESKKFATEAALNDLAGQVAVLETFKANIEKLGPIGDEDWQAKVNAAIAKIADIEKEINGEEATTEDAEAVKGLKQRMADAEQAILAIGEGVGDVLDALDIFIQRDLKSLVLRPSMYFGGIEGVGVYVFDLPKEKPNQALACNNIQQDYRFFERAGNVKLSDYGFADYHVNPSNVDLTNFSIDFYNWEADIKAPVVFGDRSDSRDARQARTRSGLTGIAPVYETTDELLAVTDKATGLPTYFKSGILTVPFKADAATIEARFAKGKGTIASLALTKEAIGEEATDTTVNSDYALIVPRYGYGLLIGDNSFDDADDIYTDEIGKDKGVAWSENLHRNFSFLALAATAPTHTIKYNEKFNISEVLESRVVLDKEDWEEIIEANDTSSLHNVHKATAKWDGNATENPQDDSDCTIAEDLVETLTPATMERLGLHYDIQLVDYVLGSNKTGESVHLTLQTDEETGDVYAVPCNVTEDGETIVPTEENPTNAACVGRQPIVCIMVKDANNNIVSFAYMKFLISTVTVDPKEKDIDFNISDIYVNCQDVDGKVTWSQIERLLLDQALEGMSKADFDNNYVFDYYEESEYTDEAQGSTAKIVSRKGIQYDANHKRIAKGSEFGVVEEEWNVSDQGVEDATTHIIKWHFTADELKALAEKLKANDGLEDNGDDYVNKEAIETYVRYAHLNYTTEGSVEEGEESDAPAVGEAPAKGKPSVWIKLILPAGKLHVAKGNMGSNKMLTYWYQLNSKTNAVGTDDAFEVRVNVPTPTPESKSWVDNIGFDYDVEDALDIRYDNLLEKADDPIAKRENKAYTEFTKDLKDFFVKGELSASVKDKTHFNSINDMKLGCEFILPSTTIGNATFNAGKNHGIDNSWTVKGYSGAEYTLILDATKTAILIKAKDNTVYPEPIELVTLNYDANEEVAKRQVTVLNYVNGVDQDDILNYKTHNELGERETFTAYINITVTNACAPVYWDNMWFNARIIRPLDLENPKQAVVPDATNSLETIDLTDALIVKDWREYYGDRENRTGGEKMKLTLPLVGNQDAFDYAYYQVEIKISDDVEFYTDANLGTGERSDNFIAGHMPVITSVADAEAKGFVPTSHNVGLILKKAAGSETKLEYKNNEGVTGGFHLFIPVEMTYVYGSQTTKQTKWVTIGVTSSVEQAQFEN